MFWFLDNNANTNNNSNNNNNGGGGGGSRPGTPCSTASGDISNNVKVGETFLLRFHFLVIIY